MKKIIKLLGSTLLVSFLFLSCKKEIASVEYLGGTAPAFTATPATNLSVLNIANKANTAITFTWTNPNYQFTTGISSQDVVYTIQVDTAGANFTSKNLAEQVISKDLTTTLTIGDFNNLLANWKEDIPHNFEFRVKSSLAYGAIPLYSNVIKMTITPYLDVAVPLPLTGKLFLIGSATPGGDAHGWDNPVPAPSQEFTKTSSTTFELTIPLIGGKEFLVIPDNGSWSNKYAVKKADVTADGGPFGYNLGDNFPGPAASGNYKIVLNFKTGKFTVTKI